MANPQCENGHTKIANEIMEALIKHKLSGQELRTILFIIRKTYGFHKKEDYISLSQIGNKISASITRCSQIITRLQYMKILTVTENLNGKTKKYLFNKDFEQWLTLNENINRLEKKNKTIKVLRKKGYIKKASTKDSITKDSITKGNKNTLKLTDEEWIQTLKENPAYKDLNIEEQQGKCIAWFQNKGITVSRQRFLNWLNRADKPLQNKEVKLADKYPSL